MNDADFRAKLMAVKLPDDILAVIREAEERVVPRFESMAEHQIQFQVEMCAGLI